MRTTIDDAALVGAMKLVAPDWVWSKIRGGDPYDHYSWVVGLNGQAYDPDSYGCDWVIRFVREKTGREPSVYELQRIEALMRGESTCGLP